MRQGSNTHAFLASQPCLALHLLLQALSWVFPNWRERKMGICTCFIHNPQSEVGAAGWDVER